MQMDNYDESDPAQILTFNEVKSALERIEGGVIHTPLCEAKISKNMDYRLYLKCENLQYTGSCSERGVRNMFLSNIDAMRSKGAIVPSMGDLATAAAYQGNLLGIPVTVMLPERSPPAHAQRCAEFGAKVVQYGDMLDDTVIYATKVQQDTGQIRISSDDLAMMAGLGTVGLEVVTQLPELDAVIVPAGDGGLLAAVLVASKKLKCSCLVYGAECSKVPTLMKSLQAGKPVFTPIVPNLADGLNASMASPNAFATLRGRLDRMLEVDEVWIARAMINVLERERLVADGAGICALAAVMQGLVPELRGKRVVCIISSGNVDCGRMARVIQRGLGASGRLLRFAVPVPDQHGGLAQLASSIAEEKGVLRSLVTEQMWVHSDVGTTWANLVVETTNEEHAVKFKDTIRDLYPAAKFAIVDSDDKHKITTTR